MFCYNSSRASETPPCPEVTNTKKAAPTGQPFQVFILFRSDDLCRAGSCAGSAVDASRCVDGCSSISECDSSNRASVYASTASQTTFSNLISHNKYLLRKLDKKR